MILKNITLKINFEMIIYNFYCYTSNLADNYAKISIFIYDKKFVKKYF